MSGAWKWAVAGAAVLTAAPLALIILGGAAVVAEPGLQCAIQAASSAGTAPTPNDGGHEVGSWSASQVANATAIVRAGVENKVPEFGWTIAVATAMQESSLRNLANSGVPESLALPHEGVGADHDSVGLFQQRPGWGSVAQRMTPAYAAGKFYAALLKVHGWQQMPLAVAAQTVQVSAYPDAYAKWQAEAEHLVDVVRDQIGITCASGATGEWQVPLPAGSYTVGEGFGADRGDHSHRGIDLIARQGTPVLAASAGTVTSAECTSAYCDRPGRWDVRGCGNTVEIQHAGGLGTTYCHLLVMTVRPGQRVSAGQEIGLVGSTGHSSGPHLHFQIHQKAPPINNSTAVDPVPVLATVGVKF